MSDRYFFDKRDWKRRFVKYGIIMLMSFVPVVLFNIYLSKYLKHNWLVILLDCVIILFFVFIGNMIANRIFERKDAKLERLQKERAEMDARKKQIMEDSYKRKRIEKAKKKEENQQEVIVEIEEPKKEKKASNKKSNRSK